MKQEEIKQKLHWQDIQPAVGEDICNRIVESCVFSGLINILEAHPDLRSIQVTLPDMYICRIGNAKEVYFVSISKPSPVAAGHYIDCTGYIDKE